ncbi:ankyrin and HET-containing protein [Glarea lozoyensis ATCC 20868]|uniref:Ankyrin and HET-containing protein n=1 Tax=Glarea lozoyensis (strain ATCC 20868 / MF5171) TaxID=1116229 RepID=S3DKL1_GLAL2|nr:ankyrin and HET-containing protein [Glarea lozoyensis ATCC 20868]EPE32591.1 ankyrin and HET-containing protein [Glarea lozoyensis ATCC 20868]
MSFLASIAAGIAGKVAREYVDGLVGGTAEALVEKAKTEIFGRPSTSRSTTGVKTIKDYGKVHGRTFVEGEGSSARSTTPAYRPRLRSGSSSKNTEECEPEVVKSLADVYQELRIENPEDQIRVVTLTPGSLDDPLDFQMKLVNYWEKDYIALSYRWSTDSREIIIDGKTVKKLEYKEMVINGVTVKSVFTNLHSALRYIRARLTRPRNIWFDAICIDQTSPLKIGSEKYQQLLLMGEIYACAEETVIWLGPPSPQSDNALSHFSSLDRVDLKSLIDRYERDERFWLDFGDGVMNRDWFGRAWMVQELACSNEVVFMCGYQQMDLQRFYDLVEFTYSSGRPFTRQESPYSEEFTFRWRSFLEMYVARRMWKTGGALTSMASWLQKFHAWGCQDKEDRILAFIGLYHDYQGELFGVEWKEMYTRVTTAVLEAEGYTDFLALGRGPYRDPTLPSWVPDLSVPYTSEAQDPPLWCGWGTVKHGRKFNSSADTKFDGSIDINTNLLTVRARLVGGITSMSRPHDTGYACIRESRNLALRENVHAGYYRSGSTETCVDALGSTLVWDLDYMGYRCAAHRGFFMDEDDIPAGFLENYTGDATGREAAWEAQVQESRLKYRLGRRFGTVQCLELSHVMYAMLPPETKTGDVVFVLTGATIPMVFRRSGKDFTLIGGCYVHEVMDGAVFEGSTSVWKESEISVR